MSSQRRKGEIQESCFFLRERQTYISRDLFIAWRNKNSRVRVLTLKKIKFNNLVFFFFHNKNTFSETCFFFSWRNQQNSRLLVFIKKRMKIPEVCWCLQNLCLRKGTGFDSLQARAEVRFKHQYPRTVKLVRPKTRTGPLPARLRVMSWQHVSGQRTIVLW